MQWSSYQEAIYRFVEDEELSFWIQAREQQTRDVYGAYGEDAESGLEYSPLLSYVKERLTDEFDVQGDEQDEDIPEELHTLVWDVVATWHQEQEARVAGLPAPVMTAGERTAVIKRLAMEDMHNSPQNAVVGDVIDDINAAVGAGLVPLDRLRRRVREDGRGGRRPLGQTRAAGRQLRRPRRRRPAGWRMIAKNGTDHG